MSIATSFGVLLVMLTNRMLLYFTTDLNEDPGTVRDLARVDPAHLQNSFKKIGLRTGPAILFFTFFMFIFGVNGMYAYLLIFHTGQIVVFLALLGLVALHIVAATAQLNFDRVRQRDEHGSDLPPPLLGIRKDKRALVPIILLTVANPLAILAFPGDVEMKRLYAFATLVLVDFPFHCFVVYTGIRGYSRYPDGLLTHLLA